MYVKHASHNNMCMKYCAKKSLVGETIIVHIAMALAVQN